MRKNEANRKVTVHDKNGPELFNLGPFLLVAGAGFEPATFGL